MINNKLLNFIVLLLTVIFQMITFVCSSFEEKNSASMKTESDKVLLQIADIFDSWKLPNINLDKHSEEFEWYINGYDNINKLQYLIKQTIKSNESKITINDFTVFGFSAGVGYPQIWIRDNSTIVAMSRYLLENKFLKSWIIAHLKIQEENGSLKDFINPDGTSWKIWVEADQESSLIYAAWIVTQALGPEWLNENVNGKTVIERLEMALLFLFNERVDKGTGLIKSAHTADWGDISTDWSDVRASALHPDTKYVVGIYTQAMSYNAMQKLSDLYFIIGDNIKTDFWKEKALLFKKKVNQVLWDKKRKFFNVHHHLDYPSHKDFDESNMFAMGGNSIAIISRLASPKQSLSIINAALQRSKLFNTFSISATLLPCYPERFFKHPALSKSYHYQNGGEWDWFGGRLILGMYQLGMKEATEELAKIADKAVSNQAIYEWHKFDGKGRGSKNYAGSAGVLGQAIIEGLFGIIWNYKYIIITPRLGLIEGYIYLPQPATNEFVAYHYKPIEEETKISMRINSNVKKKITLRIPHIFSKSMIKEIVVNNQKISFENFKESLIEGVEFELMNNESFVEIYYKR